MADETLDIAIKVRTDDLSKIKQTGQELKAVGQAAQEAAQKDGGASDESAKKTEFLSLKKGALKKLVRELGHEFPIAGMAAKAMMDPIGVAFTGAIAIFGYAKRALDDWNSEMDKTAERNAEKDFLPGIEAKSKSLHEAAAASAEFHESLKNISAGEDEFSSKVKLAIDRLHEFVAAQAEVRNASEASEIARINLAEKQGKMTGTQAIVARAGVKERYREMGERQQTAGENAELALKEKELAHAEGQAPSLEADYEVKKAAADKLRAKRAQAVADLPVADKRVKEAMEVELAAWDEVKRTSDNLDAAKRYSLGGGGNWRARGMTESTRREEMEVQKANEKAKAAVAAVEKARDRFDRDQADIDKIPINGAPVFSAEKMAAARADDNTRRIVSLGQETATLREILPVRQGGRAEANRIKSDTAGMETAGEMQEKLNQGNEKAAQLNQHIQHAADSGSSLDASTIQALKKQVEHNAEVKAQLDGLGQTISNQVKSLGNRQKFSPPGS